MRRGRVARSLLVLLHEIDQRSPQRSTRSDGTFGDWRHRLRRSKHNPNRSGVVTARDITHDPKHGCDCNVLAESFRKMLIRGDRVEEVIWRHRIATLKKGGKWRLYFGINGHTSHIHVGVRDVQADSLTPWGIAVRLPAPRPPVPVPLSLMEDDMQIVGNGKGAKVLTNGVYKLLPHSAAETEKWAACGVPGRNNAEGYAYAITLPDFPGARK